MARPRRRARTPGERRRHRVLLSLTHDEYKALSRYARKLRLKRAAVVRSALKAVMDLGFVGQFAPTP